MSFLPIRRVDFVTIYTKNLTASRKFYVDTLGFPLMRQVASEFFQFDLAGVPICVDLDQHGTHQNNIGLEVDDLAATVAALRQKGLAVHSGANHAFNEEWVGVRDPDGNEVIFLVKKPEGTKAG